MATEIKVPSMGESITSGIIAAWHVKDGDSVESGQALYELETDKITSEGQADVGGQIKLLVAEGDEVDIGQVIATIDESVAPPAKAAPKKPEKTPSLFKEKAVAERTEIKEEKTREPQPVSPAVRRLASESGIDPASIEGTGKGGRITKEDLITSSQGADGKDKAVSKSNFTAPEEAPPAKPQAETMHSPTRVSTTERSTRKKMTPMRRRIAERLVDAQRTAAILTTFNEADMSAVMGLRKNYQEKFVDKHGVKLGFMSFFVKAVVNALIEVPALNGQIDGEMLIENNFYDIAVAVGTKKGLLVPVVRDCDKLSFADIEKNIISYAKKANDGKIAIEDLQGGVFTISNGGIFGSMLSTPILNMPQSGILGMHTIQQRPVVVNKEIVIRPMMYLALSYDHRIVDGREAVTFLIKVKEAIEDPSRLMFEI